MFLSPLFRSCVSGRRTIRPSLRASDGIRVAPIPPDLLLQCPNHPEQECQGRGRWNEKQREIGNDHDYPLRCRILKARHEAVVRLGTEVILPPWETAPRKNGAVNL